MGHAACMRRSARISVVALLAPAALLVACGSRSLIDLDESPLTGPDGAVVGPGDDTSDPSAQVGTGATRKDGGRSTTDASSPKPGTTGTSTGTAPGPTGTGTNPPPGPTGTGTQPAPTSTGTGSGLPPVIGCPVCLFQSCSQEISACLGNTACQQALSCVAQKCLTGGTVNPVCAITCAGGNVAALQQIITTFTCVMKNCGADCTQALGNAGG